jgi:predicted kinase
VAGEPTPAERLDEVYGAASTERTYRELDERARRELANGRRVLLDGNFPTKAMREAALAVAREGQRPAVVLVFRVDDAEARRRLGTRASSRGTARGSEPDEYSEADVAVYERARARFEPPEEIAAAQRVDVDPHAAPEELLTTILERVVTQLEAAGRLPATFPTG